MDRRQVIRGLFPQHLQENIDFNIFIDMTAEELGQVADYIELFSALGAVDSTPERFLKDLSHTIGYDYTESQDADLQREAIKRIFSVYEQRGTEESILKTADYAKSFDWVGGDIFLTKNDVPIRYAKIFYPNRHLFRHSMSDHSGADKYSDAKRWREGVVILRLDIINKRVRDAVREVIPAGVKYFFDIYAEIYGDGAYGEIQFKEWIVEDGQSIYYNIPIDDTGEMLVYSGGTRGRRLRSGRQLMFDFTELDYLSGTSFIADRALPDLSESFAPLLQSIRHLINYIIEGIDDRQHHKGLPIRSELSGKRSGKYEMSGTRTGEVSSIFEIQTLVPNDLLYNVGEVKDKTIHGLLKHYVPSIEVIID